MTTKRYINREQEADYLTGKRRALTASRYKNILASQITL